MRKIRVGIIGFGLSGRVFHAPLIKSVEGFEIKKIYTRNEENILFAKEHYPDAEVVNDNQEIIKSDDIDLVVLATPNEYHYLLGKQALENGKNVVIEKPFVVDSEEGEKLIQVAKKWGKVLSVYQNRRFDSDFLTIKDMLDKGKFGKIIEFNSTFNRFRPYLKNNWREADVKGGGILYDLGAHLIDQALCLFGMPKSIFGDVRKQREVAKVDDYFEIKLFYGEELNNLKVTLQAGMMVREKEPKFKIIGTEGTYVKYGMDIQEKELREGKIPGEHQDWGEEPKSLWGEFLYEEHGEGKNTFIKSIRGNYSQYYENIYDAIVKDKELEVKPEESLDVIKIIELVQKSSKEKRVMFTHKEL